MATSVVARKKTSGGDRWIRFLKWTALLVFLAVPAFSLTFPQSAGRLVWTIVVASIPLFIVLVGYHRWRLICPLAFFAQIPVMLRHPGTRKVKIERNYYYIPLLIFALSLWIRLIATNGSGPAIAIFFLLLSLAALFFGVFYTGKTWCNYICPVSFIEKIYTEPQGLRETPNSQCEKCTACKTSCPDINEENGYWREIASPAKRVAYYVFPGLVFGFYFYYFLQSGTWDYYFGGSWTREPDVWRFAFSPGFNNATGGFYFWWGLPRAVAAIVTLALFGSLSFGLFYALEKTLLRHRRKTDIEKQTVRHSVFTLCAFVAFITFYSYAGQPTLRKVVPAPHFALILILFAATVSFMRRLPRSQNAFAEETLARSILKRWEWTDMEPPENLREALLIHRIRTTEASRGMQKILEAYKEALRETLEDGFVTSEDVEHLQSLRKQLGIKEADHQKIMSSLAEEERRLILDPSARVSPEKRLQLSSYSNALTSYLENSTQEGNPDDDALIQSLRQEYQISEKEHRDVLDKILGGQEGIAESLTDQVAAIERMSNTLAALKDSKSNAVEYLRALAGARRARAVEVLLRTLSAFVTTDKLDVLSSILCSEHEAAREAAIRSFIEDLPAPFAGRLIDTLQETNREEAEYKTMAEVLRARTNSVGPFMRATALLALTEIAMVDRELLVRMQGDENALVRETASAVSRRLEDKKTEPARREALLTLEKMISLRCASIFSVLPPEDLEELARASQEDYFSPGYVLCVEGEYGNEVFVVLGGQMKIVKKENDIDTVIGTATRGEVLGELAVLDPAPRSASLIAGDSGVHILRLQGPAFQEALHSNPSIAHNIIGTLVQRVRQSGQ